MPKKRSRHNLLMLAIVAIVALVAIYLTFFKGMESTGMGARFMSCEDSDSNQTGFEAGSQFIAGTVTAQKARGKPRLRTDRCYYKNQRLIEYFCTSNNKIGYKRARCAFGCEAGACRAESVLGGQTTCADSDEQDEPIFTPGTVTYLISGTFREKRDTCVNGVINDVKGTFKPASVNEFYCKAGKVKNARIDCPTAACNPDRTACERPENACIATQNCVSRGFECGGFKDECGIRHVCGTCPEGFECATGRCAETLLPDIAPTRVYYKVTQAYPKPWRRVIVEACNNGKGDMPTGAHVSLTYEYRGQSLVSMGSLNAALHAGECGQAAFDRHGFVYAVKNSLGITTAMREIPSPTTLHMNAKIVTAMKESDTHNNNLRDVAVTI